MNAAEASIEFVEPQPSNWPRKTIQDTAAQIAEKLGFGPGDDIELLIRRLGGKVHHSDWESAKHTGSIEVRGPQNFHIYLSPLSGYRRCRFTIAHELGHYVLHSQLGKCKIRVKRDGSGRVEWEANWFAAGFLMPEKEFRQKKSEGLGNAELAEYFQVSEQAVSIRTDSLS